jgi:hypothetical protein
MEEIKEEKINIENIIRAGKSLKKASSLLITMIIVTIGGFFSSYGDINTLQDTYIFVGLLNIVLTFIMISSFYEAGDYLENISNKGASLGKNQLIENQEELAPINYVQYSTDKGIVEIPPCLNLIGQKAYQNGQPAPDGKYKYSLFRNFTVENGIIIEG